MAILSSEEFMTKLQTFIGDRTDDDAIAFIEDCKDTITGDKNDWKNKYDTAVKEKDELDKMWRKRYTERFFSSDSHTNENNKNDTHTNNQRTNPANVNNDDVDEEQEKLEQAEKIRFDDLFTPVK